MAHWGDIHPPSVEINTTSPDVGVSQSTRQPDAEMFLYVWLHKSKDWKEKAFFDRKHGDHGGGNQGLWQRQRERESLLSNRKKIIDILTSQQNSSQSFGWIFTWGEY